MAQVVFNLAENHIRMLKSIKLKRQLKEIMNLKLEALKNQNFELAALHREKEKEILNELALLKSQCFIGKIIKTLFYIYSGDYMPGFYLQETEKDLPINLPYYDFSRELNFFFSCFFAEHPYFKSDWDEQSDKRRKMVHEMTEYYFVTNILIEFLLQIQSMKRNQKKV